MAGNPFDQFDPPAPPPPAGVAGNPFDQFDAPPQSVGTDMLKSAGVGLAKGVIGIGTLPGNLEIMLNEHAAPWLLNKLGYPDAAKKLQEDARAVRGDPILGMGPTSADAQKFIEDKVTGPWYEPQTRAGKVAQTVGEFAPGAAFPGGVAQRVVMNVLAPAAGAEAGEELTKGTKYETAGKIAGAVLAPTAARGVTRLATPFPAPAHRTAQAQVLDAEGVSTLASQRTGSKALGYAESTLGDYPLAGNRATAAVERQAEDFTQAVLRRAGTDARRATTDVIDDTFTRIGNVYNHIGQNNTFIPTQRTVHDAAAAIADYERLVAPAYQSNAVPRTMDAIRDVTMRGAGHVDGPIFLKLRSDITRDARRLHANDPAAADALLGVREALDTTFLAGLNQAEAQAWRQANREYRNLMVVERAAAHAKGGLLTPAQMRMGLVGQDRRGYVRGNGDYNDLVHAGDEIMTALPQSGTTPRAIAGGLVSSVSGAAGAAVAGAPGAAAAAAGGTFAPALAGRAIMSPLAQGYLGNQMAAPLLNNTSKAGAFAAGAGANAMEAAGVLEEGQTATNPETKETIIMRGGDGGSCKTQHGDRGADMMLPGGGRRRFSSTRRSHAAERIKRTITLAPGIWR
jgi:hypothetical protein